MHAGSAFSSSITASTSACVLLAGRSRRMLAMPTSAQSRCLALTYQRLPGSSPTSTVPSPGTTPRSARAATRCFSSALIAASVALPSRMIAPTSQVRATSSPIAALLLAALAAMDSALQSVRKCRVPVRYSVTPALAPP